MGRPRPSLLFFLLFLALLVLLSWTPVRGTVIEAWLAAALAAVFVLAVVREGNPKEKFALPEVPGRWFYPILLLAVALRFTGLLSVPAWPFIDESDMAWAALRVAEGKDAGWFFVKSRTPPLYPWMLAGLFKTLGVSLLTMWLLPALLSAVSVLLFPLAAGAWFDRNLARWSSLIAAFSFAFLYPGRLGFAAVSVLPLFLIAAWSLGRWLGPRGAPASVVRAAWFGISLGAGFYTYHTWPAVALFLAVLAYSRSRNREGTRPRNPLAASLAACVLVLAPLAVAAIREGTGSYWGSLGFWRLPDLWGRLRDASTYLRVAFWGLGDFYKTYKPVWGGFLNPLAGSLVLLGWMALSRPRWRSLLLWALFAHLLLILPAVLSLGVMPLRELPWFPFFPLLAAAGAASLTAPLRGRVRMATLALLVLASSGLDVFHMNVRYPAFFADTSRWGDYGKNADQRKAYLALTAEAAKKGAVLFFPSWVTGRQDLSLRVAVYGFNAADDTSLQNGDSPWVAFLCNAHYLKTLESDLPGGRALTLDKGRRAPDGGLMLYMAPYNGGSYRRLGRWIRALHSLEPYEEARLDRVPNRPYRTVLDALEGTRAAYEGDALLDFFFAEKMADELMYASLAEDDRGKASEAAAVLDGALKSPDAPAHLAYRLGVIREYLGEAGEARAAYLRATRCPLDLTASASRLAAMDGKGTP